MDNLEGLDEVLNAERVESLRLILEAEQQRPATQEEALEIGQSLIRLLKALADTEHTEAAPTNYSPSRPESIVA